MSIWSRVRKLAQRIFYKQLHHYSLPNDPCTTLGGYTHPFQDTPTAIESKACNRYEDEFCAHRGEPFTLPVVKMKAMLTMLPLMVKILTI